MSDYEHLSPETAVGYLRGVPGLAERLAIDLDDVTEVNEVGDGNLNLVFILHDASGGGVVLKQALPYVRLVGPDWPMTPERARQEYESLAIHGRLAPGLVPVLHHFDEARHIIVMEDLSDHRVWRGALNDGQQLDGVAAALGDYVAAYAFGTSALSLSGEEVKAAAVRFSNPELCRITEDLVFTEPYADIGRNSVEAANADDAAALAADTAMVTAMGWAKWRFMTAAEALIHGDLHTGSVMVRGGTGGPSTKAIDSEFSFYGPIAFDLGALWANYAIAAARAFALDEPARARWCLGLAVETWEAFEAGVRRRWPERTSAAVFTDELGDELIARWRSEAWLFAAAKMARRIVGLAKTSDIETLPLERKVPAARAVLQLARQAVRQRLVDSHPSRFVDLGVELLGGSAASTGPSSQGEPDPNRHSESDPPAGATAPPTAPA